MTRDEIINDLKVYFDIYELVGEKVYNRLSEAAWFIFDTDTLHCLLIIREELGRAITINNWFWGGGFSQRGYRDNLCDIVKKKTNKNKLYVSGHVLGCAFDFDVKGMNAESVRDWIVENADLFPCKIRLEHRLNGKPISWVHFDTKHYKDNPKIYLFDV